MKYIATLLIIISCLSCSNSSEDSYNITDNINPNEKLLTIKDYLNIINFDDTNGQLTIYSRADNNFDIHSALRNSTTPLNLNYDGKIETSTIDINAGTNDYSWSSEPYADLSYLKPMYGKKVNVSYANKTLSISTSSADANFYVPQVLIYSIDGERNEDFVLKPGTVIKWNRDVNNTNGVLVIARYDPTTQKPEIKNNYPKSITSAVSLSDTGSYTIKSGDLNALPNGASVTFDFIRANNIKVVDKATNTDAELIIVNRQANEFWIAY